MKTIAVPRGVDGRDDVVVALRAAGLDEGGDARVERDRGPSGKGKNASEASDAPLRSCPCSRAFATAIRDGVDAAHLAAPIPIVCRPFASTIAFEVTCLQTRQAKRQIVPLGL